jgi:hypothetical protein
LQPDKVAAISAFGVTSRDGKRENNPMHSSRQARERSGMAGPKSTLEQRRRVSNPI